MERKELSKYKILASEKTKDRAYLLYELWRSPSDQKIIKLNKASARPMLHQEMKKARIVAVQMIAEETGKKYDPDLFQISSEGTTNKEGKGAIFIRINRDAPYERCDTKAMINENTDIMDIKPYVTARLHNSLRRGNCETIGDVLKLTETELMSFNGLGKVQLQELYEFYKRFGFLQKTALVPLKENCGTKEDEPGKSPRNKSQERTSAKSARKENKKKSTVPKETNGSKEDKPRKSYQKKSIEDLSSEDQNLIPSEQTGRLFPQSPLYTSRESGNKKSSPEIIVIHVNRDAPYEPYETQAETDKTTSIEAIKPHVSTRLYNILRKQKCDTVNDVLQLADSELIRFIGIGEKTIQELHEAQQLLRARHTMSHQLSDKPQHLTKEACLLYESWQSPENKQRIYPKEEDGDINLRYKKLKAAREEAIMEIATKTGKKYTKDLFTISIASDLG